MSLSNALRSKRLLAPFPVSIVSRLTGSKSAPAVTAALQVMTERGLGSDALAAAIETLAESLNLRTSIEDLAQLVMTAPTESAAYHRDTRVVVTDLFRRAEDSIVVAGYAVHRGKKIFEDLARRMEAIPTLQVQLFLNLAIQEEDTSPSVSIARFAREFQDRHWPSDHRLPMVYFDRRTLDSRTGASVVFHAKCVVRDEAELFISSANFTEAAQNRNIEMGVLLQSPALARQARGFLAELMSEGVCEQLCSSFSEASRASMARHPVTTITSTAHGSNRRVPSRPAIQSSFDTSMSSKEQ